MLYSTGCEYAIRAVSHLAQQAPGELVLTGVIAEAEGLPRAFLGKILQGLVKAGVLQSARGPTGGYALTRAPSEVSLLEIKRAIDGTDSLEHCAVGLDPCSDDTPCPLHETFRPLRQAIRDYLETTTIADVAAGARDKRALIDEVKDGAPVSP